VKISKLKRNVACTKLIMCDFVENDATLGQGSVRIFSADPRSGPTFGENLHKKREDAKIGRFCVKIGPGSQVGSDRFRRFRPILC
jgi:hypothetical protein